MTGHTAAPPRYIAIEGPIGVGKTSLTRRLAASLSAAAVFEGAVADRQQVRKVCITGNRCPGIAMAGEALGRAMRLQKRVAVIKAVLVQQYFRNQRINLD